MLLLKYLGVPEGTFVFLLKLDKLRVLLEINAL